MISVPSRSATSSATSVFPTAVGPVRMAIRPLGPYSSGARIQLADQPLWGDEPVALLDPVAQDLDRRQLARKRDRDPAGPAESVAGRGGARDGEGLRVGPRQLHAERH